MNKIKEKLLKEIEKYKNERIKGISERLQADHLWFLRGKLQQHEETSKAKDEKFINLLDKLKLNIKEKTIRFADYPIIHQIIHLDIEEIKQRIKEE